MRRRFADCVSAVRRDRRSRQEHRQPHRDHRRCRASYVSNKPVPVEVSPALIRQVHATLNGSPQKGRRHSSLLSDQEVDNTDYIISLEDRKKFKLFETPSVDHYGLTQDEYRAKWGLPADYPMVAPSYAAAPGFGQDDGAWPQTKRAGNAVPSKRTQRRSQLDFVYRRFVLKRPVANGMIARNMRGGR